MDESGQRAHPESQRTATPPWFKIVFGVLICLIVLLLFLGNAVGPALFFSSASALEGLIVLCGVLFFVLVALCIGWIVFRIFGAPRGRSFMRAARPVLIPMSAIGMPLCAALIDPIVGAIALTLGIGIAVVLWLLPLKSAEESKEDETDPRRDS